MNSEPSTLIVQYKDKTLEQIPKVLTWRFDASEKFILITQLLDDGRPQTIVLNVNIVDKVFITPEE